MFDEQSRDRIRGTPARLAARLTNAATALAPPLFFGVRFWASICLALYIAFWLQLDNAFWAGTAAALVHQPQLGASLRKARFYVIGTSIGAVIAVVLAGLFPQDRTAFFVALALVGAGSAFLSTLLRNFASYAASLTGFTVAIITGDSLGPTGGLDGEVFTLAVARASEICIGVVCSAILLAVTDLGNAQQRLSELFAALVAELATRFTHTLALAGSDLPESQPVRRELARRTIALDPVIDQAIGESFQLRVRSSVLQAALNGLLSALASWRAVSVRLARQSHDMARQEAQAILDKIPRELRSVLECGVPRRWMTDAIRFREVAMATVRTLCTVPAGTPSLMLLADQTAEVLGGMVAALNALALLTKVDTRHDPRPRGVRLHVPDWLPAFVNAGRALVAIAAAALFWVVTAWPSGATTIIFATIVVTLFAPRGDQVAAISMGFMIGVAIASVFAAIIKFAVLPQVETFEAFSVVLGLYLVPVGALAEKWPTAMMTGMSVFVLPLLAPANQMTYDTSQFYNTALALLAGCGAGALSFRIVPPLSPAFRTRRLLALTLQDLRRLATGPLARLPDDWEELMYSRLAVLPDDARPLQRAQLVVGLSTGSEIIRLRRIAPRLGFATDLAAAFDALARGHSATATALLAVIDRRLAIPPDLETPSSLRLRARAIILAVSDALTQHAAYFDAGAPA
jgi:uncharacterized membrane protein YccC